MTIQHAQGTYEVIPTTIAEAFLNLPASSYLITDENLEALYGSQLPESVPRLVLPAGEATKSLESFGRCLGWLAQNGASRNSTVIALGGGVVGDLVGFVAAAYMRGIKMIQIPTTLLAMVDSSVGGKVAVDLPEGKNLAGAFWPPSEVRVPLDALASLPERQIRNGTAEVIKYGFIMDAPLLEVIPKPDGDFRETVMRCVALKAQVVQEDEFETNGRRAILNFGHTIGHAIERLTGYGPVLHGEAISVGMALEAHLGERLGITTPGTAANVEATLTEFKLPIRHESTHDLEGMIHSMRGDKKASAGRLAFSLLTETGDCKLIPDVPEALVREILRAP